MQNKLKSESLQAKALQIAKRFARWKLFAFTLLLQDVTLASWADQVPEHSDCDVFQKASRSASAALPLKSDRDARRQRWRPHPWLVQLHCPQAQRRSLRAATTSSLPLQPLPLHHPHAWSVGRCLGRAR